MAVDKPYVLGHSDPEVQRLELQAKLLRPPTLRLLHETGLGPGMSVLDMGTGAGDVAMLAAEFVGPTGTVLGIDRNESVLERARARAQTSGLDHVRFEPVDLVDFGDRTKFDLVIGRYLLCFQPDKPAFLRKAAALATVGGAIALLEPASSVRDRYSTPTVSSHDWALTNIIEAFALGRADVDVGSRLAELFHAADLPEPELFCETFMGGPSSLLPDWSTATLRSLAPTLVAAGTFEMMDFADFAQRLREDALRTQSQLYGPRSIGAWSKIT